MKREFLITGDGSITIHMPDWDEQYHSKHGAIQEAQHVFIQTGLHHFCKLHDAQDLAILEIGFGTGLNAFLTSLETETLKRTVCYDGVEAYPVSLEEVQALNYPKMLGIAETSFLKLHEVSWEVPEEITPSFTLHKKQKLFKDITKINAYHLIYFDAFGARVQPELWTEEIFKSMYAALKEEGVLVTYAAKGSVRRAMQFVGFKVERLPGPPGKREMLRATKTSN
ncbi:MAG: tRNA U34 5-methylaminomethyl-2-thiouridine-forming methyltransferase MnmC [Saprospiraceae bacterium]